MDLQPLISTIGRQLRSLMFVFAYSSTDEFFRPIYSTPLVDTLTQVIAVHCMHIQQLSINCASLVRTFALLDALNGVLRRLLLTLNLNRNKGRFDDVFAVQLASILVNKAHSSMLVVEIGTSNLAGETKEEVWYTFSVPVRGGYIVVFPFRSSEPSDLPSQVLFIALEAAEAR